MICLIFETKWIDTTVTCLTFFMELPGSNLGQGTAYPD